MECAGDGCAFGFCGLWEWGIVHSLGSFLNPAGDDSAQVFGAFCGDVEFEIFAGVVEVVWYGNADESSLAPEFNIVFLLHREWIYYIIPPDAR